MTKRAFPPLSPPTETYTIEEREEVVSKWTWSDDR